MTEKIHKHRWHDRWYDEPMIPLSVIDALIASLKCNQEGGKFDPDRIINNNIIKMLEEIKKEAIPSPSHFDYTMIDEETSKQLGPIGKPAVNLEQKIKARIAFLENRPLQTADLFNNMLDTRIIDELRKLLK